MLYDWVHSKESLQTSDESKSNLWLPEALFQEALRVIGLKSANSDLVLSINGKA